jgi:hypothetical protein
MEVYMNSISNQLCPLCGHESQFELIDFKLRKHFKCQICNEFAIATDAEKHPTMSLANVPEGLSAKSRKAPKDHILDISIRAGEIYSAHVLRSSLGL